MGVGQKQLASSFYPNYTETKENGNGLGLYFYAERKSCELFVCLYTNINNAVVFKKHLHYFYQGRHLHYFYQGRHFSNCTLLPKPFQY